MRLPRILFLFLVILFAPRNWSANTKAQLLLGESPSAPGRAVAAAIEFKMQPGWHIYWRNPGDSGYPPKVDWTLPQGVTAGQFQWPVPEKMEIAGLQAYVYEGTVLLPITFQIAADAKPGTYTIQGKVNWLECSDTSCVPEGGEVQAELVIGTEPKPSPAAERIEKAGQLIPKPDASIAAAGKWSGPAAEQKRSFIVEWKPKTTPEKPGFYPYESEDYSVSPKFEVLQADANLVRLKGSLEISEEKWPAKIYGLALDQTARGENKAVEVELSLTGEPTGGSAPAVAGAVNGPGTPGPGKAPQSLLVILAFAFLGGLILNIMPCVLPVIALKILGFVNQGHDNARRVRQLGIIYASGVVASFLALAGVVIGVKSSGNEASWGMQMQNPIFVVSLMIIMALVAMNLFGVFEITLGGSALGAASQLAGRQGRSGAFYNGVLATLLATPCTAPALAFAVGSALTQPAAVIVLVFVTIGLGLALPYVLLCWNPHWMKFLPKPGAWMEKFKMAMGFPILATAVWLASIAASQYGKGSVLWLGLFLVFLAAAAWTYGEFVQRGSKRRGFAGIVTLLLLVAGFGWALESKLHWRNLQMADSSISTQEGEIPWEKWSPEAVTKAREAGRPVLVDFTADWCLTCQVNKSTSLEIESVKRKLKEVNAIPMLADFTRANPAIAKELKVYNRAGVPLVLVFPANTEAPAIVLPEILTPGTVLEALDQAAGKPAKLSQN